MTGLKRSITLAWGGVLALFTYLEAQGVIPAGALTLASQTQDQVVTIWGQLGDLLQVISGWGMLYGMRRAISPTATKAAASVLLIGLIVPMLMGCAHYNATTVRRNAVHYIGSERFLSSECEAMRETSMALTRGPDLALYLVGRAGDLSDASRKLSDHAAQCDEVVRRGDAFDPTAAARVRTAFDASWKKVAELTR